MEKHQSKKKKCVSVYDGGIVVVVVRTKQQRKNHPIYLHVCL